MAQRKKLRAKHAIHLFSDQVVSTDQILCSTFDWAECFDPGKPLILELGMGSGDYLVDRASREPQHHFIGVEVKEERMLKAAHATKALGLSNIHFLLGSAADLGVFKLGRKIAELILQHADPWPKKRHIKRRMTSERFLRLYRHLLTPGGSLLLQHDDPDFFDWSLEQLGAGGWRVEAVDRTTKLAEHPSKYEQRFRDKGKKILSCRAFPPS